MGLKAIVAGATGLVGSRLLHLLLEDIRFETIHVLVRRPTGLTHPRLTEHLINFENPGEWKALVTGDILFSALGTTLRTAGSKANQYRVDYTYQYEIARTAAQNGISDFVLVSSAGASPGSRIFYSRMKGELDETVQKLNFRRIFILRPSFLEGTRVEKRKAEKFMLFLVKVMTCVFFRRYRPIRARMVAQAMINSIFFNDENSGTIIYNPGELFFLATS
jgi:uncharacterized protein YbjT (DUF2867 family)